MIEPAFNIGQNVSFVRSNSIFNNNTFVRGIVSQMEAIGILIPPIQCYIIEYAQGFTPTLQQIAKYNLNAELKYLFVRETELTAI